MDDTRTANCACCGAIIPAEDAMWCKQCDQYYCWDCIYDHACLGLAEMAALSLPLETITWVITMNGKKSFTVSARR